MRKRIYKFGHRYLVITSESKSLAGSISSRIKRVREKLMALEAYGKVCACCQGSNPAFLVLDHVKDDGWERRRLKEPVGSALHHTLRMTNYPDVGLQVLCHNCNAAKSIYGTCPHGGLKGGVLNATWHALQDAIRAGEIPPPTASYGVDSAGSGGARC